MNYDSPPSTQKNNEKIEGNVTSEKFDDISYNIEITQHPNEITSENVYEDRSSIQNFDKHGDSTPYPNEITSDDLDNDKGIIQPENKNSIPHQLNNPLNIVQINNINILQTNKIVNSVNAIEGKEKFNTHESRNNMQQQIHPIYQHEKINHSAIKRSTYNNTIEQNIPLKHTRHIDNLLKNEKYKISKKHLNMFFFIMSLTGKPLKRLLDAVLQKDNDKTNDIYPIDIKITDTNIHWEQRLLFLDELLYGDDIVSFYSFKMGYTLISSIECIYGYLCKAEHKKLFSEFYEKSYWVYEPNPLTPVPFSYDSFFAHFSHAKSEKYTKYGVLKNITYTITLFNNELHSIDFSLLRVHSSSTLRWFAKTPLQNTDEQIEHESIPLKSLTSKPGEKIPGSDAPSKMLLSPIIESGMEVWIYGPEKSFKSYFSRHLSHSISQGESFLGCFQASSNIKVLYIDGEMLPRKFAEACQQINLSKEIPFSSILAKNPKNETGLINLLDLDWQDRLNQEIVKHDVIVLDCYYSLTGNKIAPTELLKFMAPWKNKGKTFIIVDHANREGELQGSIDKLRSADLCMQLEKQDNGMLKLSFSRTRYLNPKDSQPISLMPTFEDDKFYFKVCEQEKASEQKLNIPIETQQKMIAMILKEKHGLKQKGDIDILFKVSDSTISNWINSSKHKTWEPHEEKLLQTLKNMELEALKKEAQALKKEK